MGCTTGRSREAFCKDEELILKEEETLGYTAIDCKEIDRTFHRFSSQFKMSDSQFTAAFDGLNIDMTKFKRKDTQDPKVPFYENFRDDENLYLVQKLTTLGIMCGGGTDEDKALTLFENYDEDTSKSIGVSEFKSMLNDLLEIALIFLPKYALENTSGLERTSLTQYIEKLLNVKNTLSIYLFQRLMESDFDELSKSHFIISFKDQELRSLLNSSKLRKLAIDKYNDLITPATLVRAYMRDEHKFMERLKEPLFKEMFEEGLYNEEMNTSK